MVIETVRIDEQGREQLIRLKRYTGVEFWNVLCRWALCVSLAEPTKPPFRLFKGRLPSKLPGGFLLEFNMNSTSR